MSEKANAAPKLHLYANTAEDLMTPDPLTLTEAHTVKEAVALMTDKSISALAVVDAEGRPTGVLSRSDIVRHDRENVDYLTPYPDFFDRAELVMPSGEKVDRGFQVEKAASLPVGDVMTPDVYAVTPDTPALMVIEKMLALRVHRLFVINEFGVLVGVIAALDVLRCINE